MACGEPRVAAAAGMRCNASAVRNFTPLNPMLEQPRRERMFNVPLVVVALIAVLAGVHAFLFLALTAEQTTEILLLFAFIPARYDASVLPDIVWPGGWGADIWAFVTYALIHGDLTHLVFNAVWLLAFGSPVARRFCPLRFLCFHGNSPPPPEQRCIWSRISENYCR